MKICAIDISNYSLGGEILNSWFNVTVAKNEVFWNDNVAEFIKRLIGEETYEKQVDYIRATMTPRDMLISS